ncbi:dienelactone hydrolase [Nemania sp. FL0916]|nr:dienelactone hydrolase [Nemania sp. FL0916]
MSFEPCCFKAFTWSGTPTGTETKLANNCYPILLIHHPTVYAPNFFGGWVVDWKAVEDDRWDETDVEDIAKKQSRDIRGPEVVACACARAIKAELGFKRLCAAQAQGIPPLVDAISMGHPSWLVEDDIDNISVPFQTLAPEHDPAYSPGLKSYTFRAAFNMKVPFDYRHFPGAVDGALV